MNYKLVLCGVGFLQELELKESESKHSIGTSKGCIIRFDKKRIGEDFQVDVVKDNNTWKFVAESGVIFSWDGKDVKELTVNPGEKIAVRAEDSEKEFFSIDYFIDYGLKNVDYDLKISLASDNTIKIGEKNCGINIADNQLEGCSLVLIKQENNLVLDLL